MKLDFSQIKEITTGAVRIEQESNGIHFYRFTKAQEEASVKKRYDHLTRTLCTSGITLWFKTNSESLKLKIETFETKVSSRRSVVDVFVNGSLLDILDNEGGTVPFGEFSKQFRFGSGEKEVRVYLPWSIQTVIKEISLDDGSYIVPVKHTKKLIAFGDSITHGYNAVHPSNKYVTRLAEYLDAEEFNKAIGGDTFAPLLAAEKDDFVPDYITVAYGTNDWHGCDRELVVTNSKKFYKTIRQNYPTSRIIAITPIWRKDNDDECRCGSFSEIETIIRDAVKDLENVTVVSGLTLVPHDGKYYGDGRLHPNDEGFRLYFENLIKSI